MSVAENYLCIKEKIATVAKKSGRSADDITLVAVTKTIDIELMREAQLAGATIFGENKPQEIRDKYESFENISWHLIGHLQKNKIKYIINRVDLIHSADSTELLNEINAHSIKNNKITDVLLQLNLSGEETKTGMDASLLERTLYEASELSNIRVKGLMTMGGLFNSEAENKKLFEKCHSLFEKYKSFNASNIEMKFLSMGMSGDFEDAIEMGSNMVRVGSSIFGSRS